MNKDSEIEELRSAIVAIHNVLGGGKCTVQNCEGCHYEMEEAANIALEMVNKFSLNDE